MLPDDPLMTPQEIARLFLADIRPWYESQRNMSGGVNANVMTVGLVMIDHMATSFPIDLDVNQTPKGQVAGLSGRRIRAILERHGETRTFTSEGGRTSRGTLDLAVQLADLLSGSDAAMPYRMASRDDRELVRDVVQGWFVHQVRRDFFDRRIEVDLDPRRPVSHAISGLLKAVRTHCGNAGGAVAQHLVGAKLSLRFPDLLISNESYTTADQQTARLTRPCRSRFQATCDLQAKRTMRCGRRAALAWRYGRVVVGVEHGDAEVYAGQPEPRHRT